MSAKKGNSPAREQNTLLPVGYLQVMEVSFTCKDYLKHHKIKLEHEEYVAQSGYFQLHDNETPLSLLISKEREAEILNAINQLPQERRKILTYRLEGLEYREIAEKMGISVHTIRNQISKATKQLKVFFEKKDT